MNCIHGGNQRALVSILFFLFVVLEISLENYIRNTLR